MSGTAKFFVDTNVILYSTDASASKKQEAAELWLEALWENQAGALSWQVLHEFYANAVRKVGIPVRTARGLVEDFTLWRPVETTFGLIHRGWHWIDAAQVSYWDSLIVAAAERAECTWLLSEDFQTGRRFGTVTVVSPFQATPSEFGLKKNGQHKPRR